MICKYNSYCIKNAYGLFLLRINVSLKLQIIIIQTFGSSDGQYFLSTFFSSLFNNSKLQYNVGPTWAYILINSRQQRIIFQKLKKEIKMHFCNWFLLGNYCYYYCFEFNEHFSQLHVPLLGDFCFCFQHWLSTPSLSCCSQVIILQSFYLLQLCKQSLQAFAPGEHGFFFFQVKMFTGK